MVRSIMSGRPDIAEGPQWQQGDHMILVMAGRPAVAFASADMYGFMAEYAHTHSDAIELADPALIASTGGFIAEVVRAVGARGSHEGLAGAAGPAHVRSEARGGWRHKYHCTQLTTGA